MAFVTSGIHHVTAIAGRAQSAIEFHCRTLGLRLVKRTVNYDDPQTYHLYFGDALGSPGSIVSLFAWPGSGQGERGDGEAKRIGLRVPRGSLGYWTERLAAAGREPLQEDHLGEAALRFDDPDGVPYRLIESGGVGAGSWQGSEVPLEAAISGIHAVTLSAPDLAASVATLTAACGLRAREVATGITRLAPAAPGASGYLDLRAAPERARGRWGAGSVHHVALRAAGEAEQDAARAALAAAGIAMGEYKDRTYFRSLYFTEPSGTVLEIATDGPGFTADESLDELGLAFRLPEWLESDRAFLRQRLSVTASPEYADRFTRPAGASGRA